MDNLPTYVLLGLILKHFVADFPLQTPFMYLNKGKYGHFGGIAHALMHSVLTVGVLLLFTSNVMLIVLLAGMEFIIHYHMDWYKVRATKSYLQKTEEGLVITSNKYFIWLGIDQLGHYLTYVLIVLLI